jgi:hypothetical protein
MLGEPRWCRARFVLGGSDRQGVCAGLGYARPPGFGRCDRHLLASSLSRRHPASRTPSREQAPRRSTRRSGLGGSRPTRPPAVAGKLTITSGRGAAPTGSPSAGGTVPAASSMSPGRCPARGGVIDSYSSAEKTGLGGITSLSGWSSPTFTHNADVRASHLAIAPCPRLGYIGHVDLNGLRRTRRKRT